MTALKREGKFNATILEKDNLLAAGYNVALYFAMLFGIASNYFWSHGLGWPQGLNAFWKLVLISSIIFLVVYVAATKKPRGLIPVLVTFQNGFFWQTVLQNSGPIKSGN